MGFFTLRFLIVGLLAGTAVAAEAPPGSISFDDQILPILRTACLRCHGDKQRKGELDLRTPQSMLRGGNGGAALEPHKAGKSLLIEMIESGEMPPEKEEPRVTPAQLELLKAWINAGAPGPKNPIKDSLINEADRRFWSFVRPVRAAVPPVKSADRVRTPIDAFVLQRLEAQGLGLNPDADRRVLVRRLYFDLIGLPPTAEQMSAFLNDTRADAYEQLVEELLHSPHYGERWARHWLDTVGYADSNGRRGDEERKWAWRYRDYVIRAINADKPYDQFLVQQVAGDELLDWRAASTLSPEMLENLIATGFLRTARDATDTEMVDMLDDRFMALHDTVEVTVNSLLGLTIGCAKCHSHKYDPIPQSDYYRLEAFFTPAYNPQNWIPANHRDIVPEEQLRYLKEATPTELKADDAVNQPIEKAIAELKKPLDELQARHRERLRAALLVKLPPAAQEAFAKAADARSPEEQKLVAQHEPQLKITDQKLLADADYRQAAKPLDAAIAAANAARTPKRPLIWALWDLAPVPPETRLLLRGDLLTPGPVVQPGVLSILDDPEHPCEIKPPSPDARTTGYRTQLARWIASDRNPLTARVFVNRVWQHHFGRGLVATPHDFGTTGARPTHPELLDWLAVEFMERGWSLKALHRLIVMSSVYQQSAEFDAEKSRVDLDNKLLWRKAPLRLEAEVLRDALLATSGQVNLEMYGPGIPVKKAADGQWIAGAAGAAANRRSIYLLNKRSESLTFLTTFDAPVMELDCPERFCSTVAQQSLAMLNSAFVVEQAEALAARIGAQAPADTPGAIRWTFERVLGRLPDAVELAALTEFLDAELERGGGTPGREQAFFQLAHTLLNTNEFLYID
jgi:mono/diheme cytochrome c family protein